MTSVQGVFNLPDGGPNSAKGALAEVERRKFTAEEGDHLTLLNGESYGYCREADAQHTTRSSSTGSATRGGAGSGG